MICPPAQANAAGTFLEAPGPSQSIHAGGALVAGPWCPPSVGSHQLQVLLTQRSGTRQPCGTLKACAAYQPLRHQFRGADSAPSACGPINRQRFALVQWPRHRGIVGSSPELGVARTPSPTARSWPGALHRTSGLHFRISAWWALREISVRIHTYFAAGTGSWSLALVRQAARISSLNTGRSHPNPAGRQPCPDSRDPSNSVDDQIFDGESPRAVSSHFHFRVAPIRGEKMMRCTPLINSRTFWRLDQ